MVTGTASQAGNRPALDSRLTQAGLVNLHDDIGDLHLAHASTVFDEGRKDSALSAAASLSDSWVAAARCTTGDERGLVLEGVLEPV
ncbi:hypothetical protein ABZ614_33510 [Streptomyces sp. NPDC013178]|uniref:hypothetical protein n=1 Tax=Streptomyces sp. NPDC013178 TaxID=3155118 RepID=UPI0033CFD5BA